VHAVPKGFERVETPYGPAWRLVDIVPVGRPQGIPPVAHQAYLDTETTGLSGGTGTQVFAASVCRLETAGLELTQLFLADVAGEAAFLHLLQAELQAASGLATYNGTRFDLPLLRTRWVMARMPGELEHGGHEDLLTLTRSLYRQRLESCTLRTVEDRVLGFEREGDVSGSMAPETYLNYLRYGWSPFLEGTLEHNRQDAISLYHLHARLRLRLAGQDPWMEAPDWLALARHLLRTGRRADGWAALRRSAEMGDGQASALAAVLLARGLAKRGRLDASERLLSALHRRLPDQVILAVARAKLLEWRLSRPETALELVGQTLSLLPEQSPHRPDLERRRDRLDARVRRRRRHRGRNR
jgi:tetratricopeptide (TPR) repeat protein